MGTLIDGLIAVAIGGAILAAGVWTVRLIATPPADPLQQELVPVKLDYRCSICGMELTVTQVPGADTRPPRHCMEPMDPVAPIT